MRILPILYFLIAAAVTQAQVPQGFRDELVIDKWEDALGIEFLTESTWLVWERVGRLWLVVEGQKANEPILDITVEVLGSGDHGLLGFAVHPDFATNGKIYLSYVVDPWQIRHPDQLPDSTITLDEWNATIGRLVEYQLAVDDGYRIVHDSRRILLGDSIQSGVPVLAPAHGVGGLTFGSDGSLLMGVGDGSTWVGNHTGGTDYKNHGYDSLGKADGIIKDWEDLGSYRAQMINSYSGKILRIDPHTGLGLPSNPYYETDKPDSPQSKVWARGLRNPFRILLREGTGRTDPKDGDPGTLYIGDVGSTQFEEINICDGAGLNFGWPTYEGFVQNNGYTDQEIINPFYTDLQNTFCTTKPTFDALLTKARQDHLTVFADSCIAEYARIDMQQASIHATPALAYGNSKNQPGVSFAPIYNADGWRDAISLGHSESPIQGDPFDGISSIVGDFYRGSSWPTEYKGQYFHGDFAGWIRTMTVDHHLTDEFHTVTLFRELEEPVVFMKFNPFDECLYYMVLNYGALSHPRELRRICYGGDAAPVARITADQFYGPAPLSVHLSATESFDPAGDSLSYRWVIGLDTIWGTSDTTIILDNPTGAPYTLPICLMVEDPAGNEGHATTAIYLDNSPPQVKITSPLDSTRYRAQGDILQLSLEAQVIDLEHLPEELEFQWSILLDHNSHSHLEQSSTIRSPFFDLATTPETAFDSYQYRLNLEVTDPLGLSSSDEVVLLPEEVTTAVTDYLNSTLLVFPNPSSGLLHLYSAKKGLEKLTLFDLAGRPLLQKSFSGGLKQELDLNSLPTGIYFLRIHLHHGDYIFKRIIKS